MGTVHKGACAVTIIHVDYYRPIPFTTKSTEWASSWVGGMQIESELILQLQRRGMGIYSKAELTNRLPPPTPHRSFIIQKAIHRNAFPIPHTNLCNFLLSLPYFPALATTSRLRSSVGPLKYYEK